MKPATSLLLAKLTCLSLSTKFYFNNSVNLGVEIYLSYSGLFSSISLVFMSKSVFFKTNLLGSTTLTF